MSPEASARATRIGECPPTTRLCIKFSVYKDGKLMQFRRGGLALDRFGAVPACRSPGPASCCKPC